MKWTLGIVASALVLSAAGCVASATTDVQTLSVSAEQLRSAFNQQADRTRLILVFSPT